MISQAGVVRVNGFRTYSLMYGGIQWWITVASHWNDEMSKISLQENGTMSLIAMPMEESGRVPGSSHDPEEEDLFTNPVLESFCLFHVGTHGPGGRGRTRGSSSVGGEVLREVFHRPCVNPSMILDVCNDASQHLYGQRTPKEPQRPFPTNHGRLTPSGLSLMTTTRISLPIMYSAKSPVGSKL